MASSVESYRAIVAGATGAIGREVVAELVRSPRCAGITALTRREIPEAEWPKEFPSVDVSLAKSKLRTQRVDWEDLTAKATVVPPYFDGHQLAVMCMGTTRREAGSAENFERVDFTFVKTFATLCRQSALLRHYAQVSSKGASANSMFLYLKTKGRADEMASGLQFPSTSIFRPGMLERGDKMRTVEKLIGLFMKGISVSTVARAIVRDFEAKFTATGTCAASSSSTTTTATTATTATSPTSPSVQYLENADITRLAF